MRIPSVPLVALQLALMASLAWPWGAASFHPAGFALLALAAALFAWTLTANRLGNFSILPEPKRDARLVTGGPDRFVRHPMYLAMLIGGLGCAAGWQGAVHLAALVALGLVLHVKAGIEERALATRFPDYAAYRERTARILPFLR